MPNMICSMKSGAMTKNQLKKEEKMGLTKKQIIEKLKNIQYEVDHIFNEKKDFFDFSLDEERQKENFDYGYIGNLGNEVYMAQQVQKTIDEILGEDDA